jgi:hypothetical protein
MANVCSTTQAETVADLSNVSCTPKNVNPAEERKVLATAANNIVPFPRQSADKADNAVETAHRGSGRLDPVGPVAPTA